MLLSKHALLVTAGLIVIVGAIASRALQADTKIAFVGTFSGPAAAAGQTMIDAQMVALEQLNAGGGVLGEKVSVDVFDDKCDPTAATIIARRIVSGDFKAVIGHLCSGAFRATADIYEGSRILLISPLAQPLQFEGSSYRFVFRMSPKVTSFVQRTVEYAARLEPKSISIVSSASAYDQQLAGLVQATAKEYGVSVSGPFTTNLTNENTRQAVELAADNRTPIVVLLLPVHLAGQAAAHLRELNSRTVLLVFGSSLQKADTEALGPSRDYVVSLGLPNPSELEGARQVVSALNEKKIPVEPAGLYGYAAVDLWAKAAASANSVEPAYVSKALQSHEFETFFGPIRFGDNGDIANFDPAFYRWRDGQQVTLSGYRGRPPPPPPPPPN